MRPAYANAVITTETLIHPQPADNVPGARLERPPGGEGRGEGGRKHCLVQTIGPIFFYGHVHQINAS
jgi:hypothetical protein